MIKYKIILFAFLLFIVAVSPAQTIERFNSFSYNVNEGLLQSHADDIAFDKNNLAWISFSNGIQKFDGHTFTDVPVQSGLPDDKGVDFFTTSNGHLLISHSEGISKYDISNNKFTLIYHNNPAWNEPVTFLGEDNNAVYFFTGSATIAAMDVNSFAITSETKTGFKDYKNDPYTKLKYTDNIIDHCIGLYADSSLIVWDLSAKKIRDRAKNTLLTTVFKLWLGNFNEILYFSNKKDNRLMKYDFKTRENKIIAVYPGDDNKSPRVYFFKWKNKYHLSYYEKIYETDSAFSTVFKELKNFQNEPVTNNFVTNVVREDRLGNLYLLTANNGIRKIIRNNYSLHYYGTDKTGNNFIVSVCADKKANRVLAGTQGNGIFIFDTLQHLIKQVKSLPGETKGFTPVNIVKLKDGAYLLFCWGKKKLWKLSKNLSDFSEVPFTQQGVRQIPEIDYFSNVVFENETMCMVHTRGAVYYIDQDKETISAAAMPVFDVLGCILYKNYLLTHANDELLFIDTASMNIVKKTTLKNTGGIRCFATDKDGNLYAGSNKGVLKLNYEGKLLWQINKKMGLPDECIYAMVFDNEGILWCSTNKGIIKVNKDNSTFQLTKDDGLQENEFNTNVVTKSADGEIFFGGVNGVSSFYPSSINSFEGKINMLISGIKINNKEAFTDTAVWNINKINLPSNENNLSFDFIAMGDNNPDQYIYQYKMEGIDKEWIQDNGLHTVKYFLPPGNYIFKIYASREFDRDAKPMKEISITINPPFWNTWWFITGLSILAITILAFGINQYNKRQYQKRLIAIESEHKMQLERERISRDLHDSLGAYANAVLYNTELLQQEENALERDELIKDLRFASKDIITALRETIWALKKDTYTAAECMLRIKNFIQPFTRYYQSINFKVEGEIPEKIIHHNRAFHLVRIVQEAISNSIKHANAKHIIVNSSTENNSWKITITDNGIGFNHAAAKELQSGNGLKNMEQRAADAGFKYKIDSEKHIGTTITIIDQSLGD